MAGLGPGQVVLCHIRKQVEQAVGRKAVSGIPLVKAKAQLVGVTAGVFAGLCGSELWMERLVRAKENPRPAVLVLPPLGLVPSSAGTQQ